MSGDRVTEQRVLVHAPSGRDAPLACEVLARAGIHCHICPSLVALERELQAGAAAVLLTEEALTPGARTRLHALLELQDPWSDLPIVVLMRPESPAPASSELAEDLGNVTLLERPVRVSALVSTVRVALRARERQYQIRAHLDVQQAHASALREADQRKDEFLATLAHELRNPLAPVRSALDILRSRQSTDSMLERVRGIMERQVDHMVRLVDDLMEVSRITRGKIELRLQPLDLGDALRDALEAAQPQVEAAGHTLEVALPEGGTPLLADPVRLGQIIGNLLNNALKYTPRGGHIQLRGWREDGQACIAVRDDGIGIPAEMLPRVFEMFTQVENVRRAGQGGLGIGLTLVRTLVELHGGSIEAHSAGSGQGSEFVVRLPLRHEFAAEAPAAGQDWSGSGEVASVRVLVVDDNQDAADSLCELLRDLGADARVVYDGATALEEVERFNPRVVLLDLGMPGMDGYEVGRRIRASTVDGQVRLVALTGWGQEDDRRRSREAGFDAHLVKPTPLAVLREVIAGG